MWRRKAAIILLVLLALPALGSECFKGDDNGNDAAALIPLPEPSADSQKVAGETQPGEIILPNGRLLTPQGNQLVLTNLAAAANTLPYSYFPANVKATPDGQYLVVPNSGRGRSQHLQTIKIPELTVADTVVYDWTPRGFYFGLQVITAPPAFSSYSYLVMVAGGIRQGQEGGLPARGRIYLFGMDAAGQLTEAGEIALAPGAFVNNFAIDQDAGDLNQAMFYVSYALNSQVAAVKVDFSNVSGATELHTVSVVKYPYDLKLSLDRERLYVTNWGVRSHKDLAKVSMIDVSDADSVSASPGMAVVREITVGKNPEGMAMSSDGQRLFVASSEEDNVAVINTATNFVERFISLRGSDQDPYGIKPTSLAFNADESILLVASSGRNSLDLVSLGDYSYLGSIPAGWNPTAVVEVGAYWYVTNGKGQGGSSNPQPYSSHVDCWETMPGSISQIPINTDAAYLAAMTMQAERNNDRQLTYFANAHEGLLRQLPIKHVIYILKENKTYDQLMGDYPGGAIGGDPSLCFFCCDQAYGDYCYTPNLHALAQRFVNLDNFYCDSEASVTGHVWNASSNITDYVEKTYLDMYRTGAWPEITGIEPTTFTKAGFILGHLHKAGISFRNYGEIVGTINPETSRQFDGVVIDSRWPLTFDQRIPDKEKVQVFIDHLNQGELASFTFMLLPNDHTEGCSTGAWHPDSLVADNDEAMGRVVDAVSHSPFWPTTLIFVTEDDPQGGADHVDGHRTIGLVISPWTKKGTTISTHYSWPNFYKTFEVFLNLPPMSTYDELASPMYDAFDTTPHLEPYKYIRQEVPMEKNGQTSELTECPHQAVVLSSQADFTAPDQAPQLMEIFWLMRHPDKPFPRQRFYAADDDDNDE
ncbi:MAG TPA: bifunctional YncE family protein/alkaline phosphatase family protein [bacterium]|nr:bifunctional YncE family protein/alkaline phosphatase family protein [bacterium]